MKFQNPNPPVEEAAEFGKYAADAVRGEFPPFGPDRGSPDAAYRMARRAAHFGRLALTSVVRCENCSKVLSQSGVAQSEMDCEFEDEHTRQYLVDCECGEQNFVYADEPPLAGCEAPKAEPIKSPAEAAELFGKAAAEVMRGEWPPVGLYLGNPDKGAAGRRAYCMAEEAGHYGRLALASSDEG